MTCTNDVPLNIVQVAKIVAGIIMREAAKEEENKIEEGGITND